MAATPFPQPQSTPIPLGRSSATEPDPASDWQADQMRPAAGVGKAESTAVGDAGLGFLGLVDGAIGGDDANVLVVRDLHDDVAVLQLARLLFVQFIDSAAGRIGLCGPRFDLELPPDVRHLPHAEVDVADAIEVPFVAAILA